MKDTITLDPPALTGDLDRLRRQLTADLVEYGLYPKEASAMLETWRDSWFEEGTRVLYIVPKKDVESILPLTVTPEPDLTTRVFVGRVEVLSPATRETLQEAVERGDASSLQKFGRFLNVYAQQMKLRGPSLQNAFSALAQSGTTSCIQ